MDPTSRHAYAIVGMACRFPGADNTHELWDMLCAGTCALEPTPPDRMRPARLGGYMRDIDAFDPLLFGISPAEAAVMDPQQRKLLEVAFECMQDAGIELHGTNTGVFVGAGMTDHAAMTANKATNVGAYTPHLDRPVDSRQSGLVRARPERPVDGRRHRVLVVRRGARDGARVRARRCSSSAA